MYICLSRSSRLKLQLLSCHCSVMFASLFRLQVSQCLLHRPQLLPEFLGRRSTFRSTQSRLDLGRCDTATSQSASLTWLVRKPSSLWLRGVLHTGVAEVLQKMSDVHQSRVKAPGSRSARKASRMLPHSRTGNWCMCELFRKPVAPPELTCYTAFPAGPASLG